MATANKLAEMAAQVIEETGLQCAICHEGPRSSPNVELGIYAFVRRSRLEEALPSTIASASTAPTGTEAEGYATVSSFVVVHFECHTKAVSLSNQNEWSVATRHNRDARCNCLMPVLMNKVKEDVMKKDKPEEDKTAGGGEEQKSSASDMDDLYSRRMAAYSHEVSVS